MSNRGGYRPGSGRKPTDPSMVKLRPIAREKREEVKRDVIIKAIYDAHGLETVVAQTLGVPTLQISALRLNDEEVKKAFKEAKERQLDITELQLFKKIHTGDLGALIWYLKTQGKDRGYVERREYSGPDGEPIPAPTQSVVVQVEQSQRQAVQMTEAMTPDDIRRAIRVLSQSGALDELLAEPAIVEIPTPEVHTNGHKVIDTEPTV